MVSLCCGGNWEGFCIRRIKDRFRDKGFCFLCSDYPICGVMSAAFISLSQPRQCSLESGVSTLISFYPYKGVSHLFTHLLMSYWTLPGPWKPRARLRLHRSACFTPVAAVNWRPVRVCVCVRCLCYWSFYWRKPLLSLAQPHQITCKFTCNQYPAPLLVVCRTSCLREKRKVLFCLYSSGLASWGLFSPCFQPSWESYRVCLGTNSIGWLRYVHTL